jgi:hypothetical protein
VSVDELKRAWQAVQAGDFRRTPRPASNAVSRPANRARLVDEPAESWTPAPGERVVPVLGAAGSVGTSTVALSLALAAEVPARVVECCSATASGLAAASTAELGLNAAGWRQGRRDRVLLERATGLLTSAEELPEPTPAEDEDHLTILDVGWDAAHLATATGWLTAAVRAAPVIVVVTAATVPGFRRLEAALELLEVHTAPAVSQVALAVVGPRRKKWPRGVEHSGGPAVRHMLTTERVVEIPHDRALAMTGLDSRPLPEPLIAAAARLLPLTNPTP